MSATFTAEDYRTVLVDNSHLLEPEDFERAIAIAQKTGRPMEQTLSERALIAPYQLLQLLATYTGVPSTELRISDIDRESLNRMNQNQAEALLVIPFASDGSTLKVAMVNPSDEATIKKVAELTAMDVEPYIALEHTIRRALILYNGDLNERLEELIAQTERGAGKDVSAGIANATEVADAILQTATLYEASDVHFEPYEDSAIVRLRIDGLLRQIGSLPPKLYTAVTAHLKVRASLQVDEHRLPQDGRLTVYITGQEINIRISLVPSLWGEKIVMRLLPKEAKSFDINSIGFLDSDLAIIRKHLKRPYGLILVCGPTGSGKSTSLYSFLQEIGSERIDVVNISTIEDPIEYNIPRVTQIQTRPEINLTFAAGLRALLRQDPDIIMVGEIRDTETADFAVRASLVGRLLVSSLHTNDAVGSIPRLLDMGVEPYLISSTLMLVVSQRLARKLCTYCRQSYVLTDEIISKLKGTNNFEEGFAMLSKIGMVGADVKPKDLRFFKAVGCDRCNTTGYSGRTGIFEIMEMSDDLRKGVNARKDAETLRAIALKEGMKTMYTDGLAKATLGVIDIDELLRVTYN